MPQVKVSLSGEVLDEIQTIAKQRRRSLSAECRERLELSTVVGSPDPYEAPAQV